MIQARANSVRRDDIAGQGSDRSMVWTARARSASHRPDRVANPWPDPTGASSSARINSVGAAESSDCGTHEAGVNDFVRARDVDPRQEGLAPRSNAGAGTPVDTQRCTPSNAPAPVATLRSAAESTGGHCRRSPTDRLMAQDCRVLIESPPSVHCGDLEGPGVATRRRARPEDRLGDPGRTPRRRGMLWSTRDGSRTGCRAVPVDPPPSDSVAS